MSSTKIYEGGGVGQSVQYLTTDWTTGFRSPAKATNFSSSACVQASSEAHLASCPKGTGGPFPGSKRCWGVTLTTHPHLVPRSRMSRIYIPILLYPWRLHGGSDRALHFYFTEIWHIFIIQVFWTWTWYIFCDPSRIWCIIMGFNLIHSNSF
jgi:hypothetical protein